VAKEFESSEKTEEMIVDRTATADLNPTADLETTADLNTPDNLHDTQEIDMRDTQEIEVNPVKTRFDSKQWISSW
jgi:hypothetical protein